MNTHIGAQDDLQLPAADSGEGTGKMVGQSNQLGPGTVVHDKGPRDRAELGLPIGDDTSKFQMEEQHKELQCLSKQYPFLEKLRLAIGASRVGRLRQELEVQAVQAKILQCLALRQETERLTYGLDGSARGSAINQEVQMQRIHQVLPLMETCWQASPQKIQLIRDMVVRAGAGERQ